MAATPQQPNASHEPSKLFPRDIARQRLAGKALQRRVGDHRLIIYPDGAAAPLKEWSLRHRSRMRDGYGSHMNGRHKMG